MANDLIVAAFACGVSRIAIARLEPPPNTFPGNWHNDVAHQAEQQDGARQAVLWQAYRGVFANVVCDLAAKLDSVTTASGESLLDDCLVTWTQEAGHITHAARDIPVVTFGGAGGALRTGSSCDYRNLSLRFQTDQNAPIVTHPGLLWQQWLGTQLQAMGIPRSEWERPAVNRGYPDFHDSNIQWAAVTAAQAYPAAVWQVAGDVLPFLEPA